ncbi:MAG: hypothetical protein ACK5LC_10755 [Coprobacillaceae bacterium]
MDTGGYIPSSGSTTVITSHSIADYVDAVIDNPFYMALDQVIEVISLAQIDRYSTKNVGDISIREEDWTTGEKVIKYNSPNKLDINDLLCSQLSRDMLKSKYDAFLSGLFPSLNDVSDADYDYYYKQFLKLQMGTADFNHTTGDEEAFNTIRNGLFLIGLTITGIGLLGYGGAGLAITAMTVDGTLVVIDLYTYLSGKDINGNPLTEKELDALGKQLLLDATLFALSSYLTIKELKGATKPLLDLDNYEIPSNRNGEFSKWFDDLSYDEFQQIWSDKRLRTIIEDRIRYPYGNHEWLMVSRVDKFKKWGVSMDDIKSLVTPTKELEFTNPWGIHGGTGSTTAHNQILGIIDEAVSYDEFVYMLNEWAIDRLPNGILGLPEGLRR